MDEKSDLEELSEIVKEFRDKRDWKKYHNPKDLSLSISIESSELLELFQWKEEDEAVDKDRLKEEMADILIYLLSLSEVTDIDLFEAVKEKVEKNKEKYPVSGEFKK